MLPAQVLLDHGMRTRASSLGYQDIQQESSSWPTVPAYGATVNAVIFNLGLHVVLKIEQVIPVDFVHLGEQKRIEFENSLVVRSSSKNRSRSNGLACNDTTISSCALAFVLRRSAMARNFCVLHVGRRELSPNS